MLLYYLFWMFMGFIKHFYIIFWTNLLTQSPVPVPIFPLFQCFEEKEYQTESKRKPSGELFLERKQSRRLGVHVRESTRRARRRGARLPPRRAPHPHGNLEASLTSTPSLLDHVRSENHAPEGFIPFGLRLIFIFFEILK